MSRITEAESMRAPPTFLAMSTCRLMQSMEQYAMSSAAVLVRRAPLQMQQEPVFTELFFFTEGFLASLSVLAAVSCWRAFAATNRLSSRCRSRYEP